LLDNWRPRRFNQSECPSNLSSDITKTTNLNPDIEISEVTTTLSSVLSHSLANNSSCWDERIPEKIRELAQARGLLDPKSFQAWTQPRLSDLRDPSVLLNMDKAVERLVLAYENQEKICLYGDFDLDGTSALALLKTGLSQLGFTNFSLYQPSRLIEGYGFHAKAVELLHSTGVTLIITADVGITAVEAANTCQNLGVDLIITDHHLPALEKPKAYALINPNQGTCPSGLGHLSGVGVAFYLVWALRRKLVQLEKVSESALDLKDLLDCFVIGTLTDMVPLKEENRVLVKHGLIQLSKTKRPGIRFLLEELGLLGKELTSQDVAIRFAPKLNALSRMELNLRPLDLFTVESQDEAKNLISQVLTQNDMRVTLQSEAEQLAMTMSKEWVGKPFVFISDPSFHKGVVGLVATRLSQVCKKPAFVGSESEEGIVVGSARAPQGWNGNLVEVLGQASDFLHRFGGHAQASGFEYSLSQKDEIINLLEKYLSIENPLNKATSIINYDVELNLDQISPQMMSWIDHLGPFGQSFEVPIFKISGVEVLSVKDLRGGHRRLELLWKGIKQEALMFGPSEEQLSLINQHFFIDLLVEMQWNYFKNRKRIQLLVKAIRPAMGDTHAEVINSFEGTDYGAGNQSKT